MPVDWTRPQDRTVQTFTEKRHFLRKEEYRAGVDELASLVEALRERIAAERGQAVEIAADSESIGQANADGDVSAEEDEEDDCHTLTANFILWSQPKLALRFILHFFRV